MKYPPLNHKEKIVLDALESGAKDIEAYTVAYPIAKRWKLATIVAKASKMIESDKFQYYMDLHKTCKRIEPEVVEFEEVTEESLRQEQINKPGGRPGVFRPEYTQMMIDYFDKDPTEVIEYYNKKTGETTREVVITSFPTKAAFACKVLRVCRDTLHRWSVEKDKDGKLLHPEFSDAYKMVRDFQESILVPNTLSGHYQAGFATFAAQNILGWRNSQDLVIAGDKEKPLVQITNQMSATEAALIYKASLNLNKDD